MSFIEVQKQAKLVMTEVRVIHTSWGRVGVVTDQES